MRVVGLDLSLTSAGLADVVTGDGRELRRVTSIGSKGRADATLAQRGDRLGGQRRAIVRWLYENEHPIDLAVVEGPSFGQARQGGQHDRAGLWWLLVDDLLQRYIPVAEVAPSARAKYATGKGNAGKPAVLLAVARRYPDIPVDGDDTADALVLAAMGARALGHPIDDMPQLHLEAMRKVRWPHTEGNTTP